MPVIILNKNAENFICKKKIIAMDKRTVYKILVLAITLSLIIILTVYFLHIRKNDISRDNPENAFFSGQDWLCETIKGIPCDGSVKISRTGAKDNFYDGRTSWTCTDIHKQEFDTFTVPRMISTNDTFSAIAKCMDINYRPHLPLTPCIIDFKVCIEDPRVPAVTLACRYLKDFSHIGDHDTSVDRQNATCGTNGTVYTYYMNTGYSTTKIDYNNENIRFEKPILPDS